MYEDQYSNNLEIHLMLDNTFQRDKEWICGLARTWRRLFREARSKIRSVRRNA